MWCNTVCKDQLHMLTVFAILAYLEKMTSGVPLSEHLCVGHFDLNDRTMRHLYSSPFLFSVVILHATD